MWPFSSSRSAQRDRTEPHFGGVPAVRAASPENPSTSLSNPDAWLLDWSNGGVPLFGPPVSEQTAMAVSAVYRCVSLLSGLIAGLPLRVYQDDPTQGRVEAPKHRLSPLLAFTPYPGRALTSFNWRELWGAGLYLWGNHYSAIRYDNAARVVGFEPCNSWSVEVARLSNGQNGYRFHWPDNRIEDLPQEDVLHICGPSFDGIKGVSRIRSNARNSVALARTFEESIGRIHENAARPSGMVELPAGITKDGLKRAQAYWAEAYSGRMNAGKPLFMDQGSKWTPFQIPPEDLNTLEFRRFQIADICRFFGVPPHLVGEAANTSAWGSGIEQLTIGFLKFTLESDLQRIEHELRLKLFAGSNFYPMFDRDALLAMDALAASQVQQSEINSGTLTINEVRRRRNRPIVEGGDTPLVNSTMVPLDRALNPPQPAPAQGPPK
jgi:HK97 family phage portal protein